MIRRITISDIDKQSLLSHISPKSNGVASMDFSGLVVNKPWGYEYLMFQNKDISIWMLYIKKGFSTSVHCHPNKKTSLLLVLGNAICSTLNEKFNLKEHDGLIFDKGVFHTTEAVSENGIFVMEVETPVDKTDLFRLTDKYKRELKGYADKKNITNKTYNYYYQFVKDEAQEIKDFGKYKIILRDYDNITLFKQDINLIKPDAAIILDGEIKFDEKIITKGEIVDIASLTSSSFQNKIRVLFLHERKNLVKLSDFVISFLQKRGFEHAFLISGGNLMHLLESLRVKNFKYTCNHHEQASSMAADAYARVANKPGFLMVTSGPGGTNAITGVAGAWIDSVPMFVISGQSYSTQTIGDSGLRQLGVQESDIVSIVKSITKYAVMVKDPKKIKYHLERALYEAVSGRPGPVWLDIPVNIQMAMIEEDELESFKQPENLKVIDSAFKEKVAETIKLIKNAKRPIILLGNGVRLAHAENEFFKLAEMLSIPIVTSRNANDLIWDNHPLYAGRPGSFGQRAANFAVQNSDLLLSIGSRISLALTGWAYRDFAREAKKVVVDIDPAELKKNTIAPDIAINADAKDFINELIFQLGEYKSSDLSEWKEKIKQWKQKYLIVLPEYKDIKDSVNTYYFTDILSDMLNERDTIVTDMGMSFQCTMQAMKLKKGQKFFTAAGHAPMGYGLPAAIGACVANKNRVICISGDGGLQMNIQELQTIVHYNLPVKLFVLNNKGYSSIRETQRAYFEGYTASEQSSGVSLPDIVKVAGAYGIKAKRIINQDNLKEEIKEVLDYNGPYVCDLNISENQLVIPKQGAFNRPDGKTVPRPIEDSIPYIDREEFAKDMIIDPVPFDPYKSEA